MDKVDIVFYFGYGATADPKTVEQIIGKKPIKKGGGVVFNFRLCLQTLNQIPESAREILKSVWGEDFLAYTLSPGKGLVAGIIWQFDQTDFEKMKIWQEIGGWRKFITIETIAYDGSKRQAQTDVIASEAQSLLGCVDSLVYPFQLNEDPKQITGLMEEEKERIAKIEKIRQQIRQEIKKKKLG